MDLALCCTTLMSLSYLASSSPLGLGPVGEDLAVPYHTTNSYIISQLKNVYNYLFNKPESIHEDGYTKIYVMGKYMYYTYTHEFTHGDGLTDLSGEALTEDPLLKKYMGPEAAKKHRATVYDNMRRKRKLEEEAKIKMAEREKAENDGGLFKRILRNIPVLKIFA